MALNATIYKTQLQVSNIDGGYYHTHSLTIARHPSETDERMMVRLVAFVFNASEQLEFTRGLSADDEPDIWQRDLTNNIDLWIEVGLPDERRIRKACNRATQVVIYSYGARSAPIWWSNISNKISRFDNLTIFHLDEDTTNALQQMVARTMSLQATIQDGELWLSDSERNVTVNVEQWFPRK